MYQPSIYSRGRSTIDWAIVLIYLALVVIGWINVYASSHAADSNALLSFDGRSGKQLIWIIAGVCIAFLVLFVINAHYWETFSIILYCVVIFLLVLVIFVGSSVKGSNSWFTLGPISFQPAEISKITSSLVLALIMSRNGFRMNNRRDFMMAAAVLLLPMLIIVAEKETGSALIYLGFLFALYREGFSGWLLVCMGMTALLFILTLCASRYASLVVLIGIVSFCYSAYNGLVKRWVMFEAPAIVLWSLLPRLEILPFDALYVITAAAGVMVIVQGIKSLAVKKRASRILSAAVIIVCTTMVFSTKFVFDNVLQDHQRSRIEVLLGMKDDPRGIGYNVTQSKIAIGSGGLLGKGFMQGTQTAFGFVPEQSTDFIFCTIGEEWGFVGCMLVLALYAVLILRILHDAERSRENFTRIYGFCVAGILFMHVFINIGMTIGLMPVIGIPLPFISYGGSSMVSFTTMLFIFLALYRIEAKYF